MKLNQTQKALLCLSKPRYTTSVAEKLHKPKKHTRALLRGAELAGLCEVKIPGIRGRNGIPAVWQLTSAGKKAVRGFSKNRSRGFRRLHRHRVLRLLLVLWRGPSRGHRLRQEAGGWGDGGRPEIDTAWDVGGDQGPRVRDHAPPGRRPNLPSPRWPMGCLRRKPRRSEAIRDPPWESNRSSVTKIL